MPCCVLTAVLIDVACTQWVLTLGLSLSSAIDILIASSMCLYLQVSRTGFKRQVSYEAGFDPCLTLTGRVVWTAVWTA